MVVTESSVHALSILLTYLLLLAGLQQDMVSLVRPVNVTGEKAIKPSD